MDRIALRDAFPRAYHVGLFCVSRAIRDGNTTKDLPSCEDNPVRVSCGLDVFRAPRTVAYITTDSERSRYGNRVRRRRSGGRHCGLQRVLTWHADVRHGRRIDA